MKYKMMLREQEKLKASDKPRHKMSLVILPLYVLHTQGAELLTGVKVCLRSCKNLIVLLLFFFSHFIPIFIIIKLPQICSSCSLSHYWRRHKTICDISK